MSLEADYKETDEILYSRFLHEGDKDALDVLLERYGASLTLFLRSYTDSFEDAEDLMMDSFVVIATKKFWSAKGSSFKTWLFAIGRKLALAHHRKRARLHLLPEMTVQNLPKGADGGRYEYEHPEQRLLGEERNARLYQALGKLPVQYREILFLLYFEQMSYEEICEIMKKNKKQLYHLAERARVTLKSELERMGFDSGHY